MPAETLDSRLAALPKAELHLHLEGSLRPATVVELAARHGVALTESEAAARYAYQDFSGFLDAFGWVTSFLRQPADYGVVTERLAEELLAQHVVYAEVTVAVGVMLWRKQDPEANFAAIREAGEQARAKGLRMQWVADGTWQFGPEAAMEVARFAARMKGRGVVAFGMGGDELARPLGDFREAYDYAYSQGLHRLAHAGEVGGPQAVFDALEPLGAERIGHGIAAMRDPALMEWLKTWHVPLEICPTSNVCTGALARHLGAPSAHIEDHPLKLFFDRGLHVTLSTDDPAMFHTRLDREYALCGRMGFTAEETARLMEMSFEAAFLPDAEKNALLETFRAKRGALGLV